MWQPATCRCCGSCPIPEICFWFSQMNKNNQIFPRLAQKLTSCYLQYIYIPGKPCGHFFLSIMGFTHNVRFFLFNCVFGFLIVKGGSNHILRQSPKEEFQPDVEQNGSRHRVPKSGHKYCHISHQIWMYPKSIKKY